jgi:hypothetical protein
MLNYKLPARWSRHIVRADTEIWELPGAAHNRGRHVAGPGDEQGGR